jgi:hypothetical protein
MIVNLPQHNIAHGGVRIQGQKILAVKNEDDFAHRPSSLPDTTVYRHLSPN